VREITNYFQDRGILWEREVRLWALNRREKAMFGIKWKLWKQEDLDYGLWSSARDGDVYWVERLLAEGANPHWQHDAALRDAGFGCHDYVVNVLRAAIKKQDAQREIERLELERQRLELERQQSALHADTGLTFAKSGPKDIDALLREATAEQEQMRYPARAGAPGRDYIPLPQL